MLVNARTKEKPVQADVHAQSNLNRGGTVDERRRAKTPLPVTEPRAPGKDLVDAQRRLANDRRRLLLARPTACVRRLFDLAGVKLYVDVDLNGDQPQAESDPHTSR